MTKYLFTSQRLGFRNWTPSDLEPMAAINADMQVMEFFPSTQTTEQTRVFIERMQGQFTEKRFCYFAVERLDTEAFIGFIGLCEQTYEADFTPCVDIGWRLKMSEWGQGFATEGARAALQYAAQLGIHEIYAVAPAVNLRSVGVMQKIGMQKLKVFMHPKLAGDHRLEDCVLFYAKLSECSFR